MDELKAINVDNEIMGLQHYIEAMAKHETSKPKLEAFENLMMHVNNLKAWAGLTDSEQQNNCNLPDVSGSLPSDEDVFKYARNITDDYTPSNCDHDSIFVFDRKTLFNIINFAKGK